MNEAQTRALEDAALRLIKTPSPMSPLSMLMRLAMGGEAELRRGSVETVEQILRAANIGDPTGKLTPAGLVRARDVGANMQLGPKVWWRDL